MPRSVHYRCLGNDNRGCHLAILRHTSIVGFISHFPTKPDKKCQALPFFKKKKLKITSTEYS